MKAAIVRSPGSLVIEEIPMPTVSAYTILCKLLYGATCTATDQHLINQDIMKARLPTILGHESIGVAVEVGAKVRNFRAGDRITRVGAPPMPEFGLEAHWGGYAEYGLATDAQAMLEDGVLDASIQVPSVNQLIPADIPDTTAPMMTTWRETLSYITRMGLTSGMKVLILGSGGNGLSFMHHASIAGASFVMGVGSESRRTNAATCGADAYLSYHDEALIEKVKQSTGAGFNLIIDAIGHPGQLNAFLPFAKENCTVGIYGIEGMGKMHMNPFCAPHSFRFYNNGYLEGETHAAVVTSIREGRLTPQPYYDPEHPYSLIHIHDAFDMLKKKEWPKALIRLSD